MPIVTDRNLDLLLVFCKELHIFPLPLTALGIRMFWQRRNILRPYPRDWGEKEDKDAKTVFMTRNLMQFLQRYQGWANHITHTGNMGVGACQIDPGESTCIGFYAKSIGGYWYPSEIGNFLDSVVRHAYKIPEHWVAWITHWYQAGIYTGTRPKSWFAINVKWIWHQYDTTQM